MRNLKLTAITEPVILLRINELFKDVRDKLEEEGEVLDINEIHNDILYEITRGFWIVNMNRAQKVQYAMPVLQGVIREVYIIDTWFQAVDNREVYKYREDFDKHDNDPKRKEFSGHIAKSGIRNKYVGHSVEYWGSNPVRYVKA